MACHEIRAILNSGGQLVKIKRDLENEIRGLLKNLGLRIGKAGGNVFNRRVEELVADQTLLQQAVRPLLTVRESVRRGIADLHRKLLAMARDDEDIRRSMTVPGIGPITALAFHSAIDEPARFRRSRSVGAYVGLTPRRWPRAKSIGAAGSRNAAIESENGGDKLVHGSGGISQPRAE